MEKDKLALEIYNVAMEMKKETFPKKLVIDSQSIDKETQMKNMVEMFYWEDITKKTICGYLRDNKRDSLAVIKVALNEPETLYHLLYRIDACYEVDEVLNNIDTLHYLTDGLMTKKNFKELINRVDDMVMDDVDYLKASKLYRKIKNLEKNVKSYCETLQITNNNMSNKNQIGVYIRYTDIPEQLEMKKKTIDNILKQNFSDKEYSIKYYIDKNVEGKNENKIEFNKMINDIKESKLNYILCPSLNNLSRDSLYLRNFFFPLIEEKNIELYTKLGKFEEDEKLNFLLQTSHVGFENHDEDYEEDDYEDDDYEY